jgi:hypothetical protein
VAAMNYRSWFKTKSDVLVKYEQALLDYKPNSALKGMEEYLLFPIVHILGDPECTRTTKEQALRIALFILQSGQQGSLKESLTIQLFNLMRYLLASMSFSLTEEARAYAIDIGSFSLQQSPTWTTLGSRHVQGPPRDKVLNSLAHWTTLTLDIVAGDADLSLRLKSLGSLETALARIQSADARNFLPGICSGVTKILYANGPASSKLLSKAIHVLDVAIKMALASLKLETNGKRPPSYEALFKQAMSGSPPDQISANLSLADQQWLNTSIEKLSAVFVKLLSFQSHEEVNVRMAVLKFAQLILQPESLLYINTMAIKFAEVLINLSQDSYTMVSIEATQSLKQLAHVLRLSSGDLNLQFEDRLRFHVESFPARMLSMKCRDKTSSLQTLAGYLHLLARRQESKVLLDYTSMVTGMLRIFSDETSWTQLAVAVKSDDLRINADGSFDQEDFASPGPVTLRLLRKANVLWMR